MCTEQISKHRPEYDYGDMWNLRISADSRKRILEVAKSMTAIGLSRSVSCAERLTNAMTATARPVNNVRSNILKNNSLCATTSNK